MKKGSFTGNYERGRKEGSTPYINRHTDLPTKAAASSSTSDAHSNRQLVGTCPDMCPAKEIAQRERLRDLSVFERLQGDPKRTSPSLAVKKFCRTISASDVNSSDIRPISVLRNTLDYLKKLLEDSSNHPFEQVHDFIFDRTRSIRQDLTMQYIANLEAAKIYEDIVKFHIISHQKLARCRDKDDSLSSLSYLNMEQLIKCLHSLYDMYYLIGKDGHISKNQAEFYSFYVLIHLSNTTPKMGDSLSLWFRKLAYRIQLEKEMQFAREILRYSRLGNFKMFFTKVSTEATNLQYSLIEPFLNEVRAKAIMYTNHSGYKLQPYPLKHLSETLMIKEEELEQLCMNCCLQTSMDENGAKLLPCKQTSFCIPKLGLQVNGISTSREDLHVKFLSS